MCLFLTVLSVTLYYVIIFYILFRGGVFQHPKHSVITIIILGLCTSTKLLD